MTGLRRHVAVFSLGGTIAMTPNSAGGVSPTLGAEALIAAVPGLADIAILSAKTLANLPSASLSFAHIATLVHEIALARAAGAEGIVVVQGTDTLEETAYGLDLLVGDDIPVVVTGAMRSAQQLGADGPANLYAAVLTAASVEARGLGTVVVINDEVHAARFVRKSHTSAVAAFTSPDLGPMGQVREAALILNWRVHPLPPLPLPKNFAHRVGIITLGLGDEGELITLAVEGGYSGLVIAGVGAGHASAQAAERIQAAAQAVPVVMSSRVGAGRMLKSTYNYPGSEIDLATRHAIIAEWAAPSQCRVLLTLLLNAPASDGPDKWRAISDRFALTA